MQLVCCPLNRILIAKLGLADIRNIAMQRYAIIDIADFSHVSNIAYAIYRRILQRSTKGFSAQSKYASIILKIFSAVTHNTHVDDTKHHLKTLMQ